MGNVAVYKKGTTDFFSQGLGLLSDVVSSNLTQTVSSTGNVEQKLEVEYPIDGYLVSELVEGAILRVSVSTDKSDYGVFEIVDTLKDDYGTITVYGDPYYNRILRMSFDNGGVFTKFSSVQSALNAAKQNITGFPADFNLISNLSTSVDLSENTYDTFGTFLEALNSAVHGNIKYYLNSIQIYSALGKDITDITLRDDMNTSSVKITTDFSGIINKVIPVLPVLDKDGNATDQTKVGTIVTSKYSNQFLDYWAGKVIQFDTQDLANTYFDRTNADRPIQTVDVDPIGLDDDFSTINIFDTIELYSTRLDYTDKLRVSERVFDTLAENVTSFKLGSSSVNIFNQINEQNNEIFNNVIKLTNAAISANGKGIDYFGQAQPSSPKEGDTWFWDDGTDFGIKQYTNGEWVDLAGSNTAEKIAAAVTEAVTQANAYSDQLVADNVAQVNAVLDDVQAKQADLTAQHAELDTKAQGYANKALADAKADTLATAQQTAKDASDALAKAKTDLTTSLNKEVTDRANAVTALDTKAKVYADTAKADAISAGATADGVINKKIDDTASSITSTISQNKTDADGKITTAQSTATQALNGLATKVSQTVYDAKTGQLQTDLNTTTTTANTAKTDIVAIKSDNTKQDARMTTIESDANGTKQTVSDLQTIQGNQSGDISTLQQRATGWDATVTKVDNLSVGGRNLLYNSSGANSSPTNRPSVRPMGGGSANANSTIAYNSDSITLTYTGNGTDEWYYAFAEAWQNYSGTNLEPNKQYTISVDVKGTAPGALFRGNNVISKSFGINNDSWTRIAVTFISTNSSRQFWLRLNASSTNGINGQFATGQTLSFKNVQIEKGNLPTDWTPAPEDLSAATAKAQLTADQAKLSINNYKTDADGRISKAQADIIVNANAITQKVSQSDYNAKTGDLTTKVNTAQSTADSATSTIGAYKTSNDARVASAESKITANATAITQKVSQSDYNTKTGQIDAQISTINQTTAGITQSVADVTTQVNTLKQVNLVNNSQLALDYSGWHLGNPWGASVTTEIWNNGLADNSGAMYVWHDQAVSNLWLVSEPVPVNGGQTVSLSITSAMPQKPASGVPLALYVKAYDANKVQVSSIGYDIPLSALDATFKTFKLENKSLASTAKYVSFVLGWNAGGSVSFGKPMMVLGSTVGDYVPGQYVNNDKISTVSQTVDSISSIVSDPTTGLTKRVQTAEGTLSQVTGADIPNLQKATYWQPYGSLDFNSYTKQGSFFFNTTSAKTNGPTSSTAWTYLMVEQGTADSGRVKQTAWYDGVTGVKITYVRTLNSGTWSPWYANDNDSVATIAQTNGAIQTEISNRATGDTNTLTQAKDFTTSSISNSESGMRSQITQTSDAILAKIEATNMVVNSEFDPLDGTWYQITTGATVGTAWNAPQAGSFQDWSVINGSRIIAYASANWYTSNLVVTSAGKAFSASIVAGRSPAPTVSTALDFRIAFWDGNRALISTMSGGNIIDGTVYKGVQKYVVENKIAPANTKYVSVVIAHSSANATDFISRPALNVGAKASPYTPTYGTTASSTVLSLLKDNWSIGIADNAGAITNGIVGNSTNMSLISNNVVINAPSTQIKGTAWINSAMIGNGQIGTAQIGDAAITSAKIANLDVSKITGDVTNFVKSGWNNAYGSNVTIDGTGMVVSYGNTSTSFENGNVLFKQLADYADGSNQVETIGSISTTHNGTVNNIVIGLYDQTHIPFGSADGKKIGSPTGEIYGGDLIAFGKARDFNGNFDHIFSYSNQTASLKYGITEGFNFRDKVNFNSNEIVSGSVNYNLKIGALKFSGKFDGRYVPVIVATWSGYIGGGIAFGGDNVVAFNQTQATIIS